MALPEVIDYPMPSASDLPAPVVDWQLAPDRCALLVHDLQPHFLRPCSIPLRDTLVSNTAAILKACRAAGVPIAHTHQPDDQSPEERGLLLDFWGAGPRSSAHPTTTTDPLAPAPGEAVIVRRRYNAFLGTHLDQWLQEQERDQLLVCGIYAHIGCLMTSAHAFMTDRQPFLVADATADFSAQEHRMALEYIACRIGVATTTADVLEALQSVRQPVGLDEIRAHVAALLGVDIDEVSPDQDLAALGLDSMRRMCLVDDWSAEGIEAPYMDVALARDCTQLHDLLSRTGHTAL